MLPNLSRDEPGRDGRGELDAELERLRARLAATQAQRDEYARQNAQFFVLQQIFSTINSTLEIDDLLRMLLRGASEALEFRSVVLFDVDDGPTIRRRLEASAGTGVVHAFDPLAFRPDSTLSEVARGELQLAYGQAGDPDRPLDDTAGAYCLAPLAARGIERLMTAVRNAGLRASAGVALFPADGSDGSSLVLAADRALYRAKQAGKDAYRFSREGRLRADSIK